MTLFSALGRKGRHPSGASPEGSGLSQGSPGGAGSIAEIPARCCKPAVYSTLRGMDFPWWTCVRIMWHGASLGVVDA